jgi:hypothetical protein
LAFRENRVKNRDLWDIAWLTGAREDFPREMRRFLPADTVRNTLENPDWWSYLIQLLAENSRIALRASGA